MKYRTRRHGSQRSSIEADASIIPTFTGQGNKVELTFLVGDTYHIFALETLAEVRVLQSQAGVLAYVYEDQEYRKEQLKRMKL